MYKQISTYAADIGILLAEVKRLASENGKGYTCTDPRAAEAVYKPLLADIFPGTWTRCFLAIIWPNGNIMPHWGKGEVIADGSVRYHLVLKTNPDCWNMHENEWQQLKEGIIYEFNPRLVHAAINWGKEWRIHFVVDIDGGIKCLR